MLEPGTLPFPEMLFPVYTNAFRVTSSMPPDYFATEVWTSADPSANLRLVESFVASRIGAAQPFADGPDSVWAREWRDGPAAIRITAGSIESAFAGHVNPAHDREPRLLSSCSIHVYPGYRATLSAKEAAQVRGARRLLRMRDPRHATDTTALHAARPGVLEVEFARDPVPACERLLGSVALSLDQETLVICARSLLVIPLERVLRVEVNRRYPARGAGDSNAVLVCSDPASTSGEISIDLCHSDRTDGLNRFAATLAARIARPAQINAAQPND